MINEIDTDILTKKYLINIKRIFYYWQIGKKDEEISLLMNINIDKLSSLRQELQQARWKSTMKRRNIRTKHIIL